MKAKVITGFVFTSIITSMYWLGRFFQYTNGINIHRVHRSVGDHVEIFLCGFVMFMLITALTVLSVNVIIKIHEFIKQGGVT